LLVYLAGDNSLSGESDEKLEAVRQGWSGADPSVRLLVYHDSADASPCLLEIANGGAVQTLETYAPENSASAAVFRRVITDTRGLYPEAVFNLLVFSHATGWLPSGSFVRPEPAGMSKSILEDHGQGMELIDFAAAIPDYAFHSITFEACFMAGIEVAYELKDKASYIQASSAEIVSPGFTEVYPGHISELAGTDASAFMRSAFGWFDGQSGYLRSSTLSVIRTEGLEALAGFVRDHCVVSPVTDVSQFQHFDRNSYHLFFDFGNYYGSLPGTDPERTELASLLANCVTWKAATPVFMPGYAGFAINSYSGLTAYIPQVRYPGLNEAYRSLAWYRAITN
jgi:hypothetical protein